MTFFLSCLLLSARQDLSRLAIEWEGAKESRRIEIHGEESEVAKRKSDDAGESVVRRGKEVKCKLASLSGKDRKKGTSGAGYAGGQVGRDGERGEHDTYIEYFRSGRGDVNTLTGKVILDSQCKTGLENVRRYMLILFYFCVYLRAQKRLAFICFLSS